MKGAETSLPGAGPFLKSRLGLWWKAAASAKHFFGWGPSCQGDPGLLGTFPVLPPGFHSALVWVCTDCLHCGYFPDCGGALATQQMETPLMVFTALGGSGALEVTGHRRRWRDLCTVHTSRRCGDKHDLSRADNKTQRNKNGEL